MCKKSVREISSLLNMPRSTVSAVILRWKREGITTALPRSGRPHKLKEKDREVLEKVALESCLPSIEAVTNEFQTVSGAKVSSRTVRRELHEMGLRGRVPTYSKPTGEFWRGRQSLIIVKAMSIYICQHYTRRRVEWAPDHVGGAGSSDHAFPRSAGSICCTVSLSWRVRGSCSFGSKN